MSTLDAPAPTTPLLVTIRRAVRLSPALGRGVWVTLLLALIGTTAQIAVPIALQQVLDREVVGVARIDLVVVAQACLLAAAVTIVAMIANRTATVRLVTAAASGLTELRIRVFRHIHDLSALHVQSERRGVLVARVTSDVEAVTRFMEWGGLGMMIGGAQLTLTVGAMLVYDWRLALMVVAVAVIYALMLLAFQRVLQRAFDKVRVRVGETLAALSETLSGLPTIRAYGAEDRARRRVNDAVDQQFRTEFRTGALGAAMFSSAELFAALTTVVVVAGGLWLGPVDLSAGTLVAFLFLVALFIEPVQMLVELLNEAQTAAAGLRRVLEIIDTPVDIADPADGVDLPEGPLSVTFEDVDFAYGDGPLVLESVSVDVVTGRRVAVVGETGSGKSTFAKLLTRLLDPTAGRITLSGVPIERVRFASLRSRVSFVPQDGFLFDASIADNVRYGRPGATDDDVARAFDELELGDWVEAQPQGIHTRVGERGGRLSAGERQLVALVRAWIGAPDLLVLDEATSAVDPALEVRLRRAIEALTHGRTSITVAHRLSTAEAADEILVFDDGRLVERGPHDELVRRGGVYAGLHADWAAGVSH